MVYSKVEYLVNEIIRIARISAETFSYYKFKDPNAGNFYKGKNEIEGQCSDYALKFVLLWNEKHQNNKAEIVVVNQEKGIKSGSYKVVKQLTDFDIKYMQRNISQLIANAIIDEVESLILYHPEIGFYQLIQSEMYETKQHFGVDMVNKAPHVWAKVGDISVDPCWADIYDTPFIGKDVVYKVG